MDWMYSRLPARERRVDQVIQEAQVRLVYLGKLDLMEM